MNLLQIHEPGETPLPHSGGAAIGIDLGTTHSVVAIAENGVVTVLRDLCGGALVPSVVHYDADTAVVGKSAIARLQEGGADVVASVKRLMGRSRADAQALGFGPMLASGDALALTLGGKARTPVEISADILRHLKKTAEQAIGREAAKAVITVPAYFDDAARQATKDAARLAGLEVLRLINEPTAAALAYGLDSGAEGVYAIYDLGGGTFDISVLKLEKGVFQVLSTGGDTQLGGDDFDHALARLAMPDGALPPALVARARAVKEQLSDAATATLEWQNLPRSVRAAELENLMRPFIARTLAICGAALDDAGLAAKDIQGVVLVGGSTRSPYLRREVESFFGHTPLSDINPDEVVAVGAAFQAEGLTEGSDNLLLDVVPLSLGLETMGGIVEKIIHRNTPIPVAAEQDFTTYKDGQDGMIVHVVQGEREMVDQNRSLARFQLNGIPPLPAGIARIAVRFSVDADGLLSVSARECETGVTQQVTVKPSYGLAEGEIERMLMDSMQHARSDILERLLREAATEARRSVEEVVSAFSTDSSLLLPGEEHTIRTQMAVVEKAAHGRDRDLIDAETTRLHDVTRPFAERRMDRAIALALKGAHIDDAAPL